MADEISPSGQRFYQIQSWVTEAWLSEIPSLKNEESLLSRESVVGSLFAPELIFVLTLPTVEK